MTWRNLFGFENQKQESYYIETVGKKYDDEIYLRKFPKEQTFLQMLLTGKVQEK